jgi:NAD-dependent deacetylase
MPRTPIGNRDALRSLIEGARRIVAFTGAGISTESGIPDFRSPGGIWSRLEPITYQAFLTSEEARLEDWRRRFEMNRGFAAAEPNVGHRAVAALVEEGRAAGIVTQNIDGLHSRSGVPADRLVEIHGNATYAHCLDCRTVMTLEAAREAIRQEDRSPRCGRCGGLVKAAVVSFGEPVPEGAMARAVALAREADLMLVLGSSLVVQPAASLPLLAKRAGARLAIVNREPTPLDGEADLVVRSGIGEALGAVFPHLSG